MTAMRRKPQWKSLEFIDLLCGPGIDIIEGKEVPGSPLIALQTQPQFDHVYLGDRRARNVDALRRRIPASDLSRVELLVGDCHTHARTIVDRLPQWGTLALAFVDPEGFEVRFELLRTFAERSIDILFLFPSGIGVTRNAGAEARQVDSNIDQLWGTQDWRELRVAKQLAGELWSSADASRLDALDQSFVKAFCGRVATLGYVHYASSPPLRNQRNVPMYHLLFFSKHEAGLKIWHGISKIEPGGQRRLGLFDEM